MYLDRDMEKPGSSAHFPKGTAGLRIIQAGSFLEEEKTGENKHFVSQIT